MLQKNNDPWFRPKRYGYGAGLPISWQGWVSFLSIIVIIVAPGFLVPLLPPAYRTAASVGSLLVALCAIGIFVVLCRAHTKGGFKWRWGDRD
ncbi:hypothetical protein HW537_03450 [Asaia siamensis]